MTPQLSVVLPVRDVAPWVSEMLDSVLRQDVPDMEVIVVDDGSVDGTMSIVDAYALQDSRVRCIRSDTAGGGSARNLGLDVAAGRYIVFADGDDLIPDGAYRTLVSELNRSGSDMALGRHLKFSSGATWEPMAKWYDVRRQATLTLDELPELLANRACWNRVFRADFVRRIGMRFPDVPRSNDIAPVTSALLEARSIDLVPIVSYLYRDRPGTSSMSAVARRSEGLLSYLAQERRVALMVESRSCDVQRAYARVVLDADGWVHLERFLRSGADVLEVGDSVVAAVRGLLDAISLAEIDTMRVERRVLWSLIRDGRTELARRFAIANEESNTTPDGLTGELLDCWIAVLRATGDSVESLIDRDALVRDGLLTLLAIRADGADAALIVERLPALRRAVASVDTGDSEVLAALAEAIRKQDVGQVQFVSAARRLAPLVVDCAEADGHGLRVSGPIGLTGETAAGVFVAFVSGRVEVVAKATIRSGRWIAAVTNEELPDGRYTVVVRLIERDLRLDLPVVTARMPLPPIVPPASIQPLADRRDGWRFLVDRISAPASQRSRIVSAIRRRMRLRR